MCIISQLILMIKCDFWPIYTFHYDFSLVKWVLSFKVSIHTLGLDKGGNDSNTHNEKPADKIQNWVWKDLGSYKGMQLIMFSFTCVSSNKKTTPSSFKPLFTQINSCTWKLLPVEKVWVGSHVADKRTVEEISHGITGLSAVQYWWGEWRINSAHHELNSKLSTCFLLWPFSNHSKENQEGRLLTRVKGDVRN